MSRAKPFMEKYGANVAGFFWNVGTALQFVFGLIQFSPLQLASAGFNIASPMSYLFFGHRNPGVVIGGICGIIGTFLAVYPQIMAGEIGAIFGFVTFVPLVMTTMFSPYLMPRYQKSKSACLRETLGHPRRLSGLGGCIFSRLPIIWDSAAHGRWQLATIFAVWALGDFSLSFSKPEIKK